MQTSEYAGRPAAASRRDAALIIRFNGANPVISIIAADLDAQRQVEPVADLIREILRFALRGARAT